MRAYPVRLAIAIGLVGSFVAYTAPRFGVSAASGTMTFVTDTGGLNDKGFNHLGDIGSRAGTSKVGWHYKYIETTSPSDYVKNLTIAARQSQFVAAVGFSFEDPMKTVSAKFPKVNFTIIDSPFHAKNVLANVFTPEQPSYMAGVLAAGMSKTHVIGFVGGQKVPLIEAFLAGYEAGARSYDPHIKVRVAYTGDFVDQSKGKVSGEQEISSGADVIYPAAGASGLGALAAADQHHVYSIGVDTDQNYLHPNSVLTSVVKHVETAISAAIVADAKGRFKGGLKTWTLANGGVGLAPYHSLASKIPAKLKAAVEKARRDIISGKVKVPTTPIM